ncbi:MAG TPA: GNAT family N-acetyltransferase [Alphaproteobacteria bacterium]|nr:GNAT family N-acetyltransferase [Alphaproteobacteria bacterium]
MTLTIRRLDADTPEAELAARWRYDAFFAEDGDTLENSRAALMDFLRHQDGYEIGLVAEWNGAPAGLCLFVRKEIEPKHDLTPWLAALFVAPAFRRRGIGAALVRAIEDHARSVGAGTLHLYTLEAEPFYAGLGWKTRERFDWHGEDMALMAREL